MIETIDLPELVLIGVIADAPSQAGGRTLADAWRMLLAEETGASAFLEATLPTEHGKPSGFAGFLAAHKTSVPDGMTKIVIPPTRFLRLIHEGPEAGIPEGFERLRAYARTHRLAMSGVTLDFGHLPGSTSHMHELHVALEAERLMIGG